MKAEGVLEQRLRPVDSLFLEYRPLKVTGPPGKNASKTAALGAGAHRREKKRRTE